MRRFLPGFLLSLVAVGPILGCDLLKPKATDAGADGAVAVVPAATDDAAAAAVPGATTATPLTPATVPGHVHPAAGDAGHPTDGGHLDAIAPTPPLPIPPFGIDASAFKGFDAGGFKFPDAGFKPPWVH